MKKLLLLLLFAPLLSLAQNIVTVSGYVTPANPMAPRDSIPVYIEDSLTMGNPVTVYTNANGFYTYATGNAPGGMIYFLRVSIDSCSSVAHNSNTEVFHQFPGGQSVTLSYNFSPCNNSCDATLALDTLINGDIVAIFSAFDYTAPKLFTSPNGIVTISSSNQIDTVNLGTLLPGANNWVCVTYGNNCNICDTLSGGGSNPICQADFIVDTVNSFNSQVILWNTSIAPSTAIYLWDFGDGTTATGPFPTHTYVAAGTYVVCLTVIDTLNPAGCNSTHCDTIGVDSLGNLVYRGVATGFILRVLDPATIGTQDLQKENWNVYPNPASNFVRLDFDGNIAPDSEAKLLNFNGQTVATFNRSQLESKMLDLPQLPAGLYMLHIQNGQKSFTHKLQIQR